MRTGIGRITIHDVSDGVDGIQAATVSLYKSAFSLPTKPSNTLTYTFSTGQVSGDLSGWSVNVPENTQSGGIIWVTNSTALATATQTTDIISSASWSTPVTYSINGVDGTNGLHGSGSYIVTVTDVASIPSNVGKDANLYSLAGRDTQKGDILTYRDSGDTFTKQYLRDASLWTEFTFAVDGSAVINGTLAAQALIAKSVTTEQLAVGAVTAESVSTTDIFSIHVEAQSLTFVDGADTSGLLGSLDLYTSQSALQISGGGYETTPTMGWGIKSNGYAEFLGGINVKNATIEGATIIGGDIYSGNIYFTIDYNTNGAIDDIKYINYPSIPLSASSSYSSFNTEQVSIVDGQTNTYATGAYNVVTCTKKWGSVNANRFRWGMIRERAFEVKGYYNGTGWVAHDASNREVSYYVKIRFHHDTGITESGIDIIVGNKSRPTGEAINQVNSITVNGLTFMIKSIGIVYVLNGSSRSTLLQSIEVYNLAGTHYDLSDSTLNGAYEIQIIFGADTENATSTKMTVESTLTVDNDTFPG